jgi:hypothetical protein
VCFRAASWEVCYDVRVKQRGAALPTILALITVVLVAGLAMGSLSALNLQFNQKQLQRTHSELSARSGLALFLAKVHEHDMSLADSDKLNPLKPAPFEVKDLLDNGLQYEENGYRVSLHFQSSEVGYSTDNSTGEVPIQGWPDSDGVARVPPFAMDLVFKVEGGRGVQYYRATLKRVWPFAVYSAIGPVTLMGNAEDGEAPPGAQPSTVNGDIYTQWRSNEASGGSQVVGHGLGLLDEPTKLLANLEARQGYHPEFRLTTYPMHVGMRLGKNPILTPDVLDESDDETALYSYRGTQLPYELGDTESSPVFGVPPMGINDGGNALSGDFVIDYDADQEIVPVLFPALNPNTFEGRVSVRRGLALDPLYYYRADKADAELEFDSAGYAEVLISAATPDAETSFELTGPATYDSDEPSLLTEKLRLSPDENSTGGPTSTHYRIEGSVSNRQVFYSEVDKKLCVKEKFAGLELQDVVLHVKGDLDLGASQFEEPIKVYGSGATLVVDGRLVLGNAHFDAVDQGFVIFAEDIVLTGSGEFRGLMIASNSISILSREEDEPLSIYGGLMCGGYGGVFLRGTQVHHEPRYLKAINGGGDFFLHSWKRLP